jgi:hypothetical protein
MLMSPPRVFYRGPVIHTIWVLLTLGDVGPKHWKVNIIVGPSADLLKRMQFPLFEVEYKLKVLILESPKIIGNCSVIVSNSQGNEMLGWL